jgi:hypothetical protein
MAEDAKNFGKPWCTKLIWCTCNMLIHLSLSQMTDRLGIFAVRIKRPAVNVCIVEMSTTCLHGGKLHPSVLNTNKHEAQCSRHDTPLPSFSYNPCPGYTCPYLFDENQAVAKSYKAACPPPSTHTHTHTLCSCNTCMQHEIQYCPPPPLNVGYTLPYLFDKTQPDAKSYEVGGPHATRNSMCFIPTLDPPPLGLTPPPWRACCIAMQVTPSLICLTRPKL